MKIINDHDSPEFYDEAIFHIEHHKLLIKCIKNKIKCLELKYLEFQKLKHPIKYWRFSLRKPIKEYKDLLIIFLIQNNQ